MGLREPPNYEWLFKSIYRALKEHHTEAENIMNVFTELETRSRDKQKIKEIFENNFTILQEEITSKYSNGEERKIATKCYTLLEKVLKELRL